MAQFRDISYDKLMEEVKKYITQEENIALIEHAYSYAKEHHEGQYRKSGEPYLIHLLHVGYILADLGMSPTTIAAGILHDTIEDTDVTYDYLRKLDFPEAFGPRM